MQQTTETLNDQAQLLRQVNVKSGVRPRIAQSLFLLVLSLRCGGSVSSDAQTEGSVGAATNGSGGNVSTGGNEGRCPIVVDATGSPEVHVDLSSFAPRSLLWSVGYWTWPPSFGDPLAGTEELLARLEPQLIRIGGYNPDANIPDPFDEAELDDAVDYAAATGADLLLQLPLLARPDGERPTPQDAADMIHYANVMMGYGIRYVSIGNEPDLYPDQGDLDEPDQPAIYGYTAAQYCADARPMVEAVLAVDSTVQIVGPDLGYKYQPATGMDWLTPILSECGDLFDVVAVHRYPFEASTATSDAVRNDMASYRATIDSVRGILNATGQGETPLAVTEAELAWVASPTTTPDGSIFATPAHALWMADFFGVSAELDLWTASTYVLSGPDEYIPGLIGLPPERPLRPAYHAIALAVTPAGARRYVSTSTDSDLRVYASRHRDDAGVHLAIVHWGETERTVTVRILDAGDAAMDLELTVPAVSVTSLEIPDTAAPQAYTYGRDHMEASMEPVRAEVHCGW